MKKLFAILFVFAFAAIVPFRSQAQMYDKGTITINPGISFGAIGFGGYGLYGAGSGFLPLTANLEYSINDKFAVGPYVGYYSRRYRNSDFRWTALSFGARGTFHASELINDALDANINTDKLDIYASALLGIENFSTNYDDRIYNYGYTNFRLGVVIGGRYMFTDNIGGFLELGRGALGYSTLGLTFKF